MKSTAGVKKTKDIVWSSDYDFPDQRRDNKNDIDFTIKCVNYIISRAQFENDKNEVRDHIDLANNILPKDVYDYVIKPYIDEDKDLKYPNDIRKIDIITPIKERYMGEFIKQYHNFQTFINDNNAILIRNKALKDEVQKKLADQIMAKVAEMQQAQEQGQQPEEVDFEKFAKEFVNDWVDERAMDAQERLNLINSIIDAVNLYLQGFFYWFACEEVYSYRYIHADDLRAEIVPPYEYYPVSNGKDFIEDHDMGMRHTKMSVAQIMDKFGDLLDEDEKEYLKTLSNKYMNDSGDIRVPVVDIEGRRSFQLYGKKNAYASGHTFHMNDNSKMLDVFHTVWKTEIEGKVLSYRDEDGQIQEMEVSKDYELNPFFGDISVKKDWFLQVMEAWRIGAKVEGVYVKARPLDTQRHHFSNISDCKLPYNGLKGILRDNRINPVPLRIAPYAALINIYTLQQERAISKFKTFNLIPESILLDSGEFTTEQRLAYARMDDLLPYNDIDIPPHILQGIKNLYNQGAVEFIKVLGEVIDSLRRSAWDVANMNEQRYGDINQQAGKSVTEYAISKAALGSILLFSRYNAFRERDYMANIDWSKAAWIDGKAGSYVDTMTGETKYVSLDGTSALGLNIGVHVRNTQLDEEKLQQFRELAFSAAQNGEFDVAAEAIASDHSVKIKSEIKKVVRARREMEAAMQKAQEFAKAEVAKAEQEKEQQKNLHNFNITRYKEEQENYRAELKAKVDLITSGGETGDNEVDELLLKLKERQQSHKEDQDLWTRQHSEKQLEIQRQKATKAN
jgi:hypothetical protein